MSKTTPTTALKAVKTAKDTTIKAAKTVTKAVKKATKAATPKVTLKPTDIVISEEKYNELHKLADGALQNSTDLRNDLVAHRKTDLAAFTNITNRLNHDETAIKHLINGNTKLWWAVIVLTAFSTYLAYLVLS